MKHGSTKPYIAAIGIALLAAASSANAAPVDDEIRELRNQNKRLTELVEKQSAEIKRLKTQLSEQDRTIAPVPIAPTNAPKPVIGKPFDKITITQEESKAFQGTYIQLFSTRFNETESVNLEFVFKKHGSKVVREDHFDPFSADRSAQLYKTEIRYEFADPRCLATCNLIKKILEERYGLEDIPIIHESQYDYKGDRRYVEVYICEDLTGQSAEFKDEKIPLRFW